MLIYWIVLAALLFTSPVLGDANIEISEEGPLINSRQELEVFVGPKGKVIKSPNYPRREQQQGREGWVQLGMMISPEGKAYEVVVTDSTGNKAFEKAALNAVKKWVFQPALMDGVPIDAGSNFKIKFALSGAAGASSKFVRAIGRFKKHIANDDKEAADKELSSIRVKNLYEDAFLNIARYSYYEKWGSDYQRLYALRRGIAHEDDAHYLPKKLYVTALLSMFFLEVKQKDFARALKTWKLLEGRKLDDNTVSSLQNVVNKITVLESDDRTYSVAGEIGESFSWNYRLLKNNFNITVEHGELAEIKLRCDKKYVFFRYKPKTIYRISEKYGHCGIEVVGNPGSKFSLIQS